MLVVCEDPDMASFLAQLFAGAYDLKVMGELGQAAEQLGTLRPQVVICSAVTLDPAMTGVIRHIRRSRHMAQVPVILLTSASRSGMKIEGLESEVDICLAFPFDIAHLRNVVGLLLRRYES
ncbi:response regulator transcription factor, partial [Alistipes onderdonkii]